MTDHPPLLEIKGLHKSFSGIAVLNGVDLNLYPGEIHALIGPNGAGKSTLIKLIAGGLKRDAGEIRLKGEAKNYSSPRQACRDGIGVVYQETSLVPPLTVLENIFLGVEQLNTLSLIDKNGMRRKFFEVCGHLKISIDPDRKVSHLGVVEKKLVEILKALVRDSQILIMDEPTDSLQGKEIQRLLEIVEGLKYRQVAVLYITHKLEEIFRVADRISILKDGKKVKTVSTPKTDRETVIRLMVGESEASKKEAKVPRQKIRKTVLKVGHVTKRDALHDISFEIREGEILGITGLVGSGKTELARVLFGADPVDEGQIHFQGKEVRFRSPREAATIGIGLVPEDRNTEGLVMDFEIYKNITLPTLHRFGGYFGLSRKRELTTAEEQAAQLGIQPSDGRMQTKTLSGGNLQKLVIAKWLLRHPRLLLLDEPTRGMDVKARGEILELVRNLAEDGCGIAYFSSDLAETLQVAHRVLVLHRGRIIRETDTSRGEEEILSTILN